jgi:hypothetical protein
LRHLALTGLQLLLECLALRLAGLQVCLQVGGLLCA